jgi:hypothetical protein
LHKSLWIAIWSSLSLHQKLRGLKIILLITSKQETKKAGIETLICPIPIPFLRVFALSYQQPARRVYKEFAGKRKTGSPLILHSLRSNGPFTMIQFLLSSSTVCQTSGF